MMEDPKPAEHNPLVALSTGEISGVLALVIRTEGPSYRSVGAAMVFGDDGTRYGSLSSGCIEADLAIHADNVRQTQLPQKILYGRGSPFIDIQLPCGGGLEILLLPQPNAQECALISTVEQLRKPLVISIDLNTGQIGPSALSKTTLTNSEFHLRLTPDLTYVVFGKGPEAYTFANLVHSLGSQGTLVSPDEETLQRARVGSWNTEKILHAHCPADLRIDDRTAVVLFFHDHEWEAPILRDVLQHDTFYVGCQGSMRTRDNRMAELESLGIAEEERARIHGPIGLIPSVRNTNILAVSVLAEILSLASSASA